MTLNTSEDTQSEERGRRRFALLYRAPVDTSPATEGVTLFKY